MRTFLTAVVLALVVGDAARAATNSSARLLLLPLENASGSEGAPEEAGRLIREALERRGWMTPPPEVIEPLLEKERVRYLDSLEPEVRVRLLAATESSAILIGTVYSWRGGDDPLVAIATRLIDQEGRTVWANVVGLTGRDTEHVLGLGRTRTISELAVVAVRELTDSMPGAGHRPARLRQTRKPFFSRAARTYRSASLEADARMRVCLLPLENYGTEREAPRIAQELLMIRMLPEFDVVEPAEFRAAMRSLGLRSLRGISPAELGKLGEKIGTTRFLRGSVYEWREAPPRSSALPPEVDVEFTLADVVDATVLFSSGHARRGDDYQGLLLLGGVSNAVSLCDRVIIEMLAAGESKNPVRRLTSPSPNER